MWKASAIVIGFAVFSSSCGDDGGGGTDSGTSTTTATTAASSGATTSATDTGVGMGEGPCHVIAADWTVEVVPVESSPSNIRLVFWGR